MQIQTVQYTTYKYDELSDEAKEKAIQHNYDINIEHDWWMYDDMFYYAGKEDYGIEINMSRICFDLDRGSYLYFDTHDHGSKYDKRAIAIIDSKKFLKRSGFDLRKVKHLIDNVSIDTKHYGGGDGKNIIECYDCTQEEEEQMQSCLDKFIYELLNNLRNDYDSLTSREAIEETIRMNDYDFLADGSIFYLHI